MSNDTLNIKEWADKTFLEYKKDIEGYIKEGIKPIKAFHIVMDSSTLGAGYRAQMRKEFNLSILD